MTKREHGQYFTVENPFNFKPFLEWFEDVYSKIGNKTILEPFAGANYLVKGLGEQLNKNLLWACFDIDPMANEKKVVDIPIVIKDVLNDFPTGYELAVTNPPYLAKNSAKRRGIEYKQNKYDDLYKYCLEKMLENCDYVVAIIPESFITQRLFTERLERVISVTKKLFNDTECPVCIAMFGKDETNDFNIYLNNELLGTYNQLRKLGFNGDNNKYAMQFNNPRGQISVITIDNSKEDSICFYPGEHIDAESIKVSSRSFSRILLDENIIKNINLEKLIQECNNTLEEKRAKTKDVFFTSFKGIRKDEKYRRRVSFSQVREIIEQAIEKLNKE